MNKNNAALFGTNLKKARISENLSQSGLARQSDVTRTKIVRIEAGGYIPRLDESCRLAAALKIPLQQLITGKKSPSVGLKGIAFELYQLGIRDYVVEGATAPGAFRRREQVVVLALKGDKPETRLVEAMPVLLATHTLCVGLALAFANVHDRRVRARLAWLSDVTLSLSRLSTFPFPLQTQEQLEKLTRAVRRPAESDNLGYPAKGLGSPLWRRWNITYNGTINRFLERAQELATVDKKETEE
jgi:transcriptional regulator with XRE-family HTH domain